MPNYSSHLICNFTILSAILLVLPLLDSEYTTTQATLFTLLYIIGTIWFNPDMDTRSEGVKRCGFICKPYRYFFNKHRGISHHPIWGVLTRIIYIFVIISAIYFLVIIIHHLFLSEILIINMSLIPKYVITNYQNEILFALFGFTLSNHLHIVLDKVKSKKRKGILFNSENAKT